MQDDECAYGEGLIKTCVTDLDSPLSSLDMLQKVQQFFSVENNTL